MTKSTWILTSIVGVIFFSALLAFDQVSTVLADNGGIQPVPRETTIDVITRDRDLIHLESRWPDTVIATNVSKKHVSGFLLLISVPQDEVTPVESMGWGVVTPWSGAKQEPMLGPSESISLTIPASIVKAFENQPFLYLQTQLTYAENDPEWQYTFGADLKRVPGTIDHYRVVIDPKGRVIGPDGKPISKAVFTHDHNNHLVLVLHNLRRQVAATTPNCPDCGSQFLYGADIT